MKLSDILDAKGHALFVALDDARLDEIVQMMCRENIGSVVIRTMAGSILGIINERDIIRTLGTNRARLNRLKATDAMQTPAPTITSTATVFEGLQSMIAQRSHYLVVTTGANLAIGLVSIGDLVKTATSRNSIPT